MIRLAKGTFLTLAFLSLSGSAMALTVTAHKVIPHKVIPPKAVNLDGCGAEPHYRLGCPEHRPAVRHSRPRHI